MEQQGALAARGEDENSQAEGIPEGAVGFATVNRQPGNPHYENIYEAIEPYAAAAPAENHVPIAQIINLQNNSNNIRQNNTNNNTNNNNNNSSSSNNNNQNHPLAYRNELYDRTAGYDIPRLRRNNMHFELNPKRPRYNTSLNRPHHQRQRSFDDTESYHNYIRYENIYEQIHEEPIYSRATANGGRVYGRLDVIGHGIGRIERHLSSSCGNIDHYNLGGHYAVLGHSHLGTMGHIRVNTANTHLQTTKHSNDDNSKGNSGFFSCLGGENSQSMSNIYKAINPRQTNSSASTTANVPQASTSTSSSSRTGAIPKSKKISSSNTNSTKSSSPPQHTSSLNRISKSSLQWLLVNKWLPLWVGGQSNGPDYKIIDFNFMFSRNCEGCGENSENRQSLLSINGQAEVPTESVYQNTNSNLRCGTTKTLKNNPNLVRLRECEHGSLRRNDHYNIQYDYNRSFPRNGENLFYHENDHNPFRNWELNADNNTFRPAGGRTHDINRLTPSNRQKNQQNVSISLSNNNSNENTSSGSSAAISPLKPENLPSTSSSSTAGVVHSDKIQTKSETEDDIYYHNSDCTEDDQADDSDLSEADED